MKQTFVDLHACNLEPGFYLIPHEKLGYMPAYFRGIKEHAWEEGETYDAAEYETKEDFNGSAKPAETMKWIRVFNPEFFLKDLAEYTEWIRKKIDNLKSQRAPEGQLHKKVEDLKENPFCSNCGSLTQRFGKGYKCMNCGNSEGLS